MDTHRKLTIQFDKKSSLEKLQPVFGDGNANGEALYSKRSVVDANQNMQLRKGEGSVT